MSFQFPDSRNFVLYSNIYNLSISDLFSQAISIAILILVLAIRP